MSINVAILSSGRGSYLEQLVSKLKVSGFVPSLVISNLKNAEVLDKAKALDIDERCIEHKAFSNRDEFDQAISAELKSQKIDLILLVGFMRILGKRFCKDWTNKIINVHPSLLPKYQGLMDLDVHRAVLENHDCETGCSVHWVTESVDAGPVICQERLTVLETDDCYSLKKKVQALEVDALVKSVKQIVRTSNERNIST